MNARVATVAVACAYLLAHGSWLLAQMSIALAGGRPVADIAVGGARGLLLTQALIAAGAAPLFVAALGVRAAATSLVAIVAAALPLLTFISLTTTLAMPRLLAAEGTVIAVALATAGLAALVVRAVHATGVRCVALGVLQIGAAAACWRLHEAWIAGVAP
jgi:hypothetical protein